jgi:hypothetical protein
MLSSIRWKKSHFEVCPDMADYIKQTTNKSLEKYEKNKKINLTNPLILLKDDKLPNTFLLAFVSMLSFLAGYKFKQLTN